MKTPYDIIVKQIITEKTTYSAFGDTTISVPNKILNMK